MSIQNMPSRQFLVQQACLTALNRDEMREIAFLGNTYSHPFEARAVRREYRALVERFAQ